ncbi:MAG TPA: Uma2 family endonuclease [Chloroflexota bacterium]|nr:Uma2 family endonuclease [Chloroflexota bacterium]
MSIAARKRNTNAPKPRRASYSWPLVLRTRPVFELTEDQFFELCQLNAELWIERSAEGEWQIMPPVGGGTGSREAEIILQLGLWAKRERAGTVFSSAAGFRLPNGAVRAPDASWVLNSRLEALSPREWERFIPLCPDFVLELRSPSDRLEVLHAKLEEYLANGARLGWLLDPDAHQVYVYRPDAPVQRLHQPETVSGDPVLPGFALDLREVW